MVLSIRELSRCCCHQNKCCQIFSAPHVLWLQRPFERGLHDADAMTAGTIQAMPAITASSSSSRQVPRAGGSSQCGRGGWRLHLLAAQQPAADAAWEKALELQGEAAIAMVAATPQGGAATALAIARCWAAAVASCPAALVSEQEALELQALTGGLA